MSNNLLILIVHIKKSLKIITVSQLFRDICNIHDLDIRCTFAPLCEYLKCKVSWILKIETWQIEKKLVSWSKNYQNFNLLIGIPLYLNLNWKCFHKHSRWTSTTFRINWIFFKSLMLMVCWILCPSPITEMFIDRGHLSCEMMQALKSSDSTKGHEMLHGLSPHQHYYWIACNTIKEPRTISRSRPCEIWQNVPPKLILM